MVHERKLQRAYAAREGVPRVDRVDVSIFTERYFGTCMDCGFCQDACCQYGCSASLAVQERVMTHADALEARIGIGRDQWFEDTTSEDADEPTGRIVRTQVRGDRCVFHIRGGRGCHIHAYCLEQGLDYHLLKPQVCSLFPVVYSEGALKPAYEIREERSLVCMDQGPNLYRGARDELRHIFGEALVEELDALEAELAPRRQSPARPPARSDARR